MSKTASLGEDLLAVVEVEMPLEVPHHLVTVGTLLLQRFAQVNSLHVKSEVAATVRLVVALVAPVVEDLPCSLSEPWSLKPLLHTSHINTLLSSSLACTEVICFDKFILWLKALSHIWHLKGFSPVCVFS